MIRILVLLFVLLNTISGRLYSHHGVPRDINLDKQTLILGTIDFVEWANPHVLIHITSSTGRGLEKHWTLYADSPREILSRGLSRAALDTMGTVRFTIYESGPLPCSANCTGHAYNLVDSFGRIFVMHQDLYDLVNQLSLGN